MGEHGCLAITFGQQMGNIFKVALFLTSTISITEQPKYTQRNSRKIHNKTAEIYQTGSYYLTGSTSKDVDTPHTGTGRITGITMYPMTLYETGESNGQVSLMELFDDKKTQRRSFS